MDQELKQRLIGASVIIALAIIFVPMLFDGDGIKQQNQNISIEIPESPQDLEVKTFDIDKPVADQQINVPESDVSLSQSTTTNDQQNSTQPQLIDTASEEQQSEYLATENVAKTTDKPPVEQTTAAENKTQNQLSDQTEPVEQEKVGIVEQTPVQEPQQKPQPNPVSKPPVSVDAVDLAYRVKLGSFSKQANAQKVKSQLMQKNIRSIVEKDGTRNLFHVWSADMYQRKDKAEQYVKAVNALKLNIGQPSVQSMNAEQVDALAQQGQLGWVVQLGSFSAKDNAIELRNKVKAAGFSGFVDRVKNSKGEDRFRLRVGPLMEKKDAVKVQADIGTRLKITGLIKTHEPGLPVES